MRLLVTDIGGTNARVALCQDTTIYLLKIYPTRYFGSAIELFSHFQKDTNQKLPPYWAVAAAGVTSDEKIEGTNLKWDISKRELIEAFNLRSCILLNDFEAAAYGLSVVDEKRLLKLAGETPQPKETKILIGAGTGLGEATCVYCKGLGWKALRSEGGHATFAPTDETEMELAIYLKAKYRHVSYERILSGLGLLELYGFFMKKDSHKDMFEETFKSPSQVTEAAEKGDKPSIKAIKLFCKIYGEEAGNFALKTLPLGGVFITGGVSLHIVSWLQKGWFQEGFVQKGRMTNLLKNIPVFLVKEPYLGIYGGAYRLLQTCMTKATTAS